MLISFIEKGTSFDIEILAQNPEQKVKLNGFLHEIRGNATLFIEGDELYEYFTEQPSDSRLCVNFFRDKKNCSFHGKFERTLKTRGVKLTEINATTVIEEVNRRTSQRFSISMDIKIHEKTDDGTVKAPYAGYSYDISYDAVCLLSNFDLNNQSNNKFDVEFSLQGRNYFKLPAALLRKERAPVHSRYKYNYVFVFDFSECPDEKSRLLDSLFMSKLEARQNS